MRRGWTTGGVLVSLALLTGACGDDEGSADPTTTAEPTTTTEAGADLDRFLVQTGELAGFAPAGEPTRLLSLDALVDEFGIDDAEHQRLREHGFESSVNQQLESSAGAGITAVDVFGSEDGAARELEHLVITKETGAPAGIGGFERFEIPGVPSAVGWTFDKPGGSTAADVHWTQGRCVMSLGSEPPVVDDLRAAVKAIYDRTGGTCP